MERNECAAHPAKSARARSPLKRERASRVQLDSPTAPKRDISSGRAGRRIGRMTPSKKSVERSRNGRMSAGPRVGVRPDRGPCRLQRPLQERRGSIVEGMRERGGRMHPLEAELPQRQALQKGRDDGHRMDGRADVVPKPGKGSLLGAAAAADRRSALEHQDRATGPCHDDRRGQAIRSGADDDGIVGRWH